ncbi:MAG TPA: Sec-independent protein translocase protein TatB [Stellaceae bacterium]|nr:Sec-independent protein translocase protein TatB [Stellaceae bacterium]
MFFDIGWPEFMVIGVVALLVIGPKDLPAALKVAGYWVRKARSLSREFHSSVEQMMREVELHEVQNELRKATDFDLDREFNKIIDPVNDPAAGPKPREIPDFVDTTPAPADPEPLMVGFGQAEDELKSPLSLPLPAAQAEPEPARAAEPTKP